MKPLYEPLYSHSRGCAGFSCLVPVACSECASPVEEARKADCPCCGGTGEIAVCGKFCRTERGVLAHLEQRHGLRPQRELPLP